MRGRFRPSIVAAQSLDGFYISGPIGRATTALALPQHGTQALHHRVLCVVDGVFSFGQLRHRCLNALGLVDRALFADGQVHRQMQKWIGLSLPDVEIACFRCFRVG